MNRLFFREEDFNSNFYYFSGVDIDHAFYLERDGNRTLLVPRMNERLARTAFRGKVIAYGHPLDELKKHLRGKRVHIDGNALPWSLGKKLQAFCKPEDMSRSFLLERMRKSKLEIAAIARAARTTRNILDGLELREGMRETDVKKQLLRATLEAGTEAAFEPIVATAANARFPHYRAGRSALHDMVLIDYGVKCDRYCSDVTRCFFLRKNKPMQEAYAQAQAVSDALLDTLPSLRTGKDVAAASDVLMKKHGLPPLIHSIGHGVGLDVHEYPRLNLKSDDPIKGTVMAIEPAAYFARFGVRYENTIYFDGKKARIL